MRLWDARGDVPRRTTLTGNRTSVTNLSYSDDGRLLAAGVNDSMAGVWDTRTRRKVGGLLDLGGVVQAVRFIPGGRVFATLSGFRGVRLWGLRGRKPRGARLRGSSGAFVFAVSRDGQTIATAGRRQIKLWDVRTRRPLGTAITVPAAGATADSTTPLALAFDRDGRTIASAHEDGIVRLWDTRAHKQLGSALRGHAGRVEAVAFSPDGRTLASAGTDGTVRLRDARSHRPLGGPLIGDSEPLRSVAFSPDGDTLAAAGDGGSIRLWDVRARKPIGVPLTLPRTGNGDALTSVAFSPDGSTLASGGLAGPIQLWRKIFWGDPGELRDEICHLVGSGLSTVEWERFASGLAYRRSC